MIGVQVGAYRVQKKLGEGGMGSIWVAQHAVLGKRVAIKVLHREMSVRQDLVSRFFNEAKAATEISDPGIVQVFDFGTLADGNAYLVMELLEGEGLDKRLTRLGTLSLVSALRACRQVAVTLGAAHARGIVHRDIKPDNIFLVRDPEVAGGERTKVLDFGIAKMNVDTRVKTNTSALLGTPTFMSPEQCRGAGQVDHRSDVYSLGCVLFTLLTGRPVFDGEGAGDIIAMHLREPPPVPSSLRQEIPAEVDALILRCLAKDRAKRFSSGSELASAIEKLLASPALAPFLARAAVEDAEAAERDTAVTPPIEPSTPSGAVLAMASEPALGVAVATTDPVAGMRAPANPAPPSAATLEGVVSGEIAGRTPKPALPTLSTAPIAKRLARSRVVHVLLGVTLVVPVIAWVALSVRRSGNASSPRGGIDENANGTALEIVRAEPSVPRDAASLAPQQGPTEEITLEGPSERITPATQPSSSPPAPTRAQIERDLDLALRAFAKWRIGKRGYACPTIDSVFGTGAKPPLAKQLRYVCDAVPATHAIGVIWVGSDGRASSSDDVKSWLIDTIPPVFREAPSTTPGRQSTNGKSKASSPEAATSAPPEFSLDSGGIPSKR